ncbi:MAG: DUF4381 domain-containing protein [Candidatus Competibacteraceae bacterium]|nr:DUF4381 domain-containing protein [Candidatus Competibacteraceae bacterium]
MPAANPLADLRDIHLPEPVSWWPPAPGWWLLAVLSLLVVGGLLWWRHHRRRTPQRVALAELTRLRVDFQRDGDGAAIAAGISTLLRRLALAHFPRNQVAGLVGDAWLRFLDRTGGGNPFSAGPGRALIQAPYRCTTEALEIEALLNVAEAWIRRVGNQRATVS